MKNYDCNQIKIFINLKIIGEKKLYLFFLKIYKIFYNLMKLYSATLTYKLNFYYTIYDVYVLVNICKWEPVAYLLSTYYYHPMEKVSQSRT